MKIEILYPEICYLYGDLMNIEYLHRCLPEAEIIKTSLKTVPAFVSGGVGLVYLCSMTERAQELVINALRPYTGKNQRADRRRHDLSRHRQRAGDFHQGHRKRGWQQDRGPRLVQPHRKAPDDGPVQRPLSGEIRRAGHRGPQEPVRPRYEAGGTDAVYGENVEPLFMTTRGAGRNPGVKPEGIRKNNFMATYVLGPLLIMNPPFTKYLLGLLGAGDQMLAYEKAAMDAYALRLSEYSDPKRGFDY